MSATNNGERPMTEGQLQEHAERFARPFCEHGITAAEYNRIREDPDYKGIVAELGRYARKIAAVRSPLGSSLPLNLLPMPGTVRAESNRYFEWEDRSPEEERYELIKASLGQQLNIGAFDLVESGPQNIPGWPQCLVVTPLDLFRHIGYEVGETKVLQPRSYCRIATRLLLGINPRLLVAGISGWLSDGNVRLHSSILRQWEVMPDRQVSDSPLKIRRMSVNPAAWFGYRGAQYSLIPHYIRSLAGCPSVESPVRSFACGDLVVFATLLAGEPHLLEQMYVSSTSPFISLPGTQLREKRGDWGTVIPACHFYEGFLRLSPVCTSTARSDTGPLLCATA